MKRALLVWEMGGGFGHISRLEMIAQRLSASGCQVILVVKDISLTMQWLGHSNFLVLGLPDSAISYSEPVEQINYSSILASAGYRNLKLLNLRISAWLDFYNSISPDCIVCDHAPTAVLAAVIAKFRVIQFGGGFELPPSDYPLPSMRSWKKSSNNELEEIDSQVLQSINKISSSYGAVKYGAVGDIFSGKSIFTTFQELDHYSRSSRPEYIGPIYSERLGLAREWPTSGGKKIFAYLHSSTPGYHALVQSLRRSGHSVVCVSPGVSKKYIEDASGGSLMIVSQMIELGGLIPDIDFAVVTGGSGVVSRLLLKGIPLLIAPQNLEQHMLAERVVSLGSAKVLGRFRGCDTISGLLCELACNDAYRSSATNFSNKYQGYSPVSAVSKVVESALQLTASC